MHEVSVPVSALERILQTLTSAFYYSQTYDMQEAYRQGKNNPKWSKMTSALSHSIQQIENYIEIGTEEEDKPDDPSNDT